MHVGIVGAGITGLNTALLLRREGHRVTLFECADRVGGRIFTYRFPSKDDSGDDVFFEAGAMRVPRSPLHKHVFDLIDQVNSSVASEDQIEFIPYVLEHQNNLSFIQGQKGSINDKKWSRILDLPEPFCDRSAPELLGSVIQPWLALLRDDFDNGFNKVLEHDELSFRNYLRLHAGWPHEVVEYVELMCSQTNQFDLSFTELIMQNLDFDTKEWVTIKDGMSRLPNAVAGLVGRQNIHLNSKVNRIANLPDGRVLLSTFDTKLERHVGDFEFDKVVLAIPPAAVNNIVDKPRWSFLKEQFLRGAHYEPLYKIGIRFKSRFWESAEKTPCFGGQSTTDLRFRWIVFPSNGMGTSGAGVLLLYCWMSDALKWIGLPQEERIRLCLHDLSRYFADVPGVDVHEQFVEAFDICWTASEATGDAMFLPGQFSRYFKVAARREGNVYFAGEHLSRHHTWIAGALESSLHTTAEILDQSPKELRLTQQRPTVPQQALGGWKLLSNTRESLPNLAAPSVPVQ